MDSGKEPVSTPGTSRVRLGLTTAEILAATRRKFIRPDKQNEDEAKDKPGPVKVTSIGVSSSSDILKNQVVSRPTSASLVESLRKKYLGDLKSSPGSLVTPDLGVKKLEKVSLPQLSSSRIPERVVAIDTSTSADVITSTQLSPSSEKRRAEIARLKLEAKADREMRMTSTPTNVSFHSAPPVSSNTQSSTSEASSTLQVLDVKDSKPFHADLAGTSEPSTSLAALLAQTKLERSQQMTQTLIDKAQLKAAFNNTSSSSSFNFSSVPPRILAQRSRLPIYSCRQDFIDLLQNNQFLIVTGETGSGKSTQIPQFIVEAGIQGHGQIGITQPRKIAAKFLAERVAFELNVPLGAQVGYAVRFDRKESDKTIIKFETDGLLFRELSQDKDLSRYSVILIDEAHERSLDTDACLGLLKVSASRRPDLKVIISSATIETEKFSKYFKNAPVFEISGKSYPVEIVYSPQTPSDYVTSAVDKVIEITRRLPPGDILVFLPGKDKIYEMKDKLDEELGKMSTSLVDELYVLACYSGLPSKEYQKTFEATAPGKRKCVLATNIAETSITIDGIVYVIDSGRVKENTYNPKSGMNYLVEKMVTQFQAIQRTGRAGRTRPGTCFRLYSESDFDHFDQSSSPEIMRSNLASVVLRMAAMGIENIDQFDFLDSPDPLQIQEAIVHLRELGALDEYQKVTSIGRQMIGLPVDPPLAKALLESQRLGCLEEMLTIASIAGESRNLFISSKKYVQSVNRTKVIYGDIAGDLFVWLNIFNAWKANDQSEEWCLKNGLQWKVLDEAAEIREQLSGELSYKGIGFTSNRKWKCSEETLSENVRKSWTAGQFRKLAKKKLRGFAYQALADPDNPETTFLHSTSCLFRLPPEWIIYTEVVVSKKPLMAGVIRIDPDWIDEYAPEFARKLRANFHL